MSVVALLAAVFFARHGGLITGVGYVSAERVIGWLLVGFAVTLAFFAGRGA
jgi:hypothetical protein